MRDNIISLILQMLATAEWIFFSIMFLIGFVSQEALLVALMFSNLFYYASITDVPKYLGGEK